MPVESPALLGRNGAARAAITLPGYRLGRPAPNKGMRLAAEVYTPEEIRLLLAVCTEMERTARGVVSIRDRALIVALWRTGCRLDEMLRVEPRDVDLDRGTLYVRYPKRDRRGRSYPRTVPLDAGACAELARWADLRAELGFTRRQPLWCVINGGSRGQRVQASVVREKLKTLADRAGLERRVHPHGFRHTFAHERHFVHKAPIRSLQLWLGHRSIETTVRYLARWGEADSIELGRSIPWPFELTADGPGELVDVDALRVPDLLALLASARETAEALTRPVADAALQGAERLPAMDVSAGESSMRREPRREQPPAERDASRGDASRGPGAPCAWCGKPIPMQGDTGRPKRDNAEVCDVKCRRRRHRWRTARRDPGVLA